jgi:uncharacterized membrane protein
MATTKDMRKKALLMASVAGLLTVTSLVMNPVQAHAEGDEGESCYGVNACKGTGDCGGKGYSCAGQNGCKGTGFIKLPKGTCTRISGGSLTPVPTTV